MIRVTAPIPVASVLPVQPAMPPVLRYQKDKTMSEHIDDIRARFLRRVGAWPEAMVELDGIGQLKIKALSRAEVMGLGELSIEEREIKMISLCLVEPTLTEDEVRAWREAALASDIEPLTDAIAELSGLTAKKAKNEAYKSVRDGS